MRVESRTKESQRLSNHFESNQEIHGVGRGVNVVVLKGGGCGHLRKRTFIPILR